MRAEHWQEAVATAGGSFLSLPRNDGSAELFFDILEASTNHYVIKLPFTCVNMSRALSGVNTGLNLLPPSAIRWERQRFWWFFWNYPSLALIAPLQKSWKTQGIWFGCQSLPRKLTRKQSRYHFLFRTDGDMTSEVDHVWASVFLGN